MWDGAFVYADEDSGYSFVHSADAQGEPNDEAGHALDFPPSCSSNLTAEALAEAQSECDALGPANGTAAANN